MTSTPCQSAALDRIIVAFFAIIAETVLTVAEIVRTTLPELGAWLSWPMIPKLMTGGRPARLAHHRTGFLSPFGERAPLRISGGDPSQGS